MVRIGPARLSKEVLMFTRSLVLALFGLMVATSTQAQDLAADYAAAFTAFTLPGSSPHDPDAAAAAIVALLPALQGDWVRGDLLAEDTADLDTGTLDHACDVVVDRLVITSPHGFDMQHTNAKGEVSLHIRYDYIGQHNFQRWYDENEWLTRLGIEPDRSGMGHIYLNQARGEVAMFVPGPTILVLDDARGMTEIYVRCP
jgi:hypothetical protein